MFLCADWSLVSCLNHFKQIVVKRQCGKKRALEGSIVTYFGGSPFAKGTHLFESFFCNNCFFVF